MSTVTAPTTAYEKAIAAVPNAKRTVVPPKPRKKDRIKGEASKAIGKVKAGAAKPAKAKPAAKRGTGNAAPRLTDEWLSAKKRDVQVKDEVKLPNGAVLTIVGRWTKKTTKGNVPMVTGHIVSGAPKGKKVGDRLNAVAAEATHTK